MSEVIRHIPTVCYVECKGSWLYPQIDRPNIIPMPTVSMEYYPPEPPHLHWPTEMQKIIDEWNRQGRHDRYAFMFSLFNDPRWPVGTQTRFSNALAGILQYVVRGMGQDKIDFVYSDCEDTNRDGVHGTPDDEQPYYTPQELRAAFGNLGKIARTLGNWNNANGDGWWRSRFPGPVKAAIPQAYECTDAASLARISDAISYAPKETVPWLPCHCRQDERGRWVSVDDRTCHDSTRTLILDAVSQGVDRFGLFLHPFCEQDHGQPVNENTYRLTPRANRYLDLVDRTIDEANRLYGRA